ncbi:hypothetical protein [Bacillus atrophaeus]|uniref:hypothetical protein n=1 Tax=Bacillus atrophaeus TaxID=1452 RepID=UPI002E24CC66|nr:hypothetical protein [Bacillus atrophaeus]
MQDYKMSEKLFLDLWGEWGEPEEIIDGEQIKEFLTQLIDMSKGLIILDHFSFINYDHISSIKYEKPYLKIYWKDFNEYREKYLKKQLTEEEKVNWAVFGFDTYSYMLLHVNKVKFVKVKNHLFILFRTNLIPDKKAKKLLLSQDNELISEENFKHLLYKNYSFYEGNKDFLIKHDCIVNNLPYYSCLIQPKEKNGSQTRRILLYYTLQEIIERMNAVRNSLSTVNEYDYDVMYSLGNTIRRILEYTFKFLCIYKDLDIKIDKKYSDIHLGDLRKKFKEQYKDIKFEQNIIDRANQLSHDSGVIFEKEDVELFWSHVKELIETVINKVLNDN